MLFWDRLVPQSPVYNVPIALALRGSLDREALRKSIDLIVSRHEVLRSNFLFMAGEPTIKVNPAGAASVSFVDVRNLSLGERPLEIQTLANSEARRPFNLAKDPMLRAVLFRLAESEYVLVITIHHIAADGWSLGVLVGELSKAYRAFVQGKTPELPALALQYADFAEWQRELLRGPALERLLSFWKLQLRGIADHSEVLPLDRPRGAHQTFEGATLRTVVPESLLTAMRVVGQLRRATLFMAMLSVLQMLLQRHCEQNEVAIGIPVANRNQPELSNLIGCFFNTLVVRSDLSGNPSFLELLEQVRETSLAAFLHAQVPLSELVRHLRPKRNASHTPWFQVQMVFQNYPMPAMEWPGLRVHGFEVDTATSKFDLSVLIEKKEGLEIAFEYNTKLFERATIQRLLDEYTFSLEHLVSHPDTRLRDFPARALASHA